MLDLPRVSCHFNYCTSSILQPACAQTHFPSSTHISLWDPLGPNYGQTLTSARCPGSLFTHKDPQLSSRPALSLSPHCVVCVPVFRREIGFCRARRLESPEVCPSEFWAPTVSDVRLCQTSRHWLRNYPALSQASWPTPDYWLPLQPPRSLHVRFG